MKFRGGTCSSSTISLNGLKCHTEGKYTELKENTIDKN